MQAASLALRTDKSPVAVAKVDLVFVSSMVQYILVYHHEYIFSLKKKKIPHANCRKIFLEVGSEK